jgi:phosphoribosylglycinamide formyltransferase-1
MAQAKLKLAVLISGRGSNLQALIDACASPDFPARIAVVLSNVPDAYGLTRAQNAGISTIVVNHKDFPDKRAFESAMAERLQGYDIDLICLAGFMRILSADFIAQWPDKIINIHPSLLPAYKGLNTHERAIKDGAKQAGCTVHYVVPEMDSGPMIVQRAVDVLPDDTAETLAERVLQEEHKAYPEAILKILENSLASH